MLGISEFPLMLALGLLPLVLSVLVPLLEILQLLGLALDVLTEASVLLSFFKAVMVVEDKT